MQGLSPLESFGMILALLTLNTYRMEGKMKLNQVQPGKLYRITKCPAWEYLTVGEIYECTNQHPSCVGFHRPNGGPGTYLMGAGLRAVEIDAI